MLQKNIVEESNRRRDMAAARREGSWEASGRIAARVTASIDEALVAVSYQRPSLRRDDVMVNLDSNTWLWSLYKVTWGS